MDAQEKDVFELPTINPWRQEPTREQVRFALDLCRSELPAPEYAATRDSLRELSRAEMSILITRLKDKRATRMHRSRRLAPRARRR